MFSNNPMQQRPVVYVFVQGQNGDVNAPRGAQVVQSMPQQQQQQQQQQLQNEQPQRHQHQSSPGQILQRVAAPSHTGPLFAPPSLGPPRLGSPQDTRNQGTQPTGLQPSSAQQQAQQHGNVEIISIPHYAPSAQQQLQQQHMMGGQAAFPPPGSTIQMITNQGLLQSQQQPSMMYSHMQSHPRQVPSFQDAIRFPLGFPIERNAMGNLTMSRTPIQLQQPQQQGLIPTAPPSMVQHPVSMFAQAPAPTSSQGSPTTASGPPPIDPNVKFLHAPPGVRIPPQTFPSYQLVPAGYQVVLGTNADKTEAEAASKVALTAAASRATAEQQEDDEEEDEEKLLREPIVLSGTPYSYPVNIGKDVVSGKGGRAQQYNRHFRNLITEAYPRYNGTGSKIEKREIGIRIYLTIVKSGGRFLDADGHPMNRSKAILKVMKALKDAKTWANDARRLANKKRKVDKEEEAVNATDERRQQQGKSPADETEDNESPRKVGAKQFVEDYESGHDEELHEESDEDEEMIDEDDFSEEDLLASQMSEKTAASLSVAAIPTVPETLLSNSNNAQESKTIQASEPPAKAPEKSPPSGRSLSLGNLGKSDDTKPHDLPTGLAKEQAPEKPPPSDTSMSVRTADGSNDVKLYVFPTGLIKEQAPEKSPPSGTSVSAGNPDNSSIKPDVSPTSLTKEQA